MRLITTARMPKPMRNESSVRLLRKRRNSGSGVVSASSMGGCSGSGDSVADSLANRLLRHRSVVQHHHQPQIYSDLNRHAIHQKVIEEAMHGEDDRGAK